MTNIWADSFKEIREPFFNIEDPYTLTEGKKEKEENDEDDAGEDQEHKYTKKSGKKSKDYDGDGEVEDETDEYAGVKDRAIKKAMKMKEERELQSKRKKDKLDVMKGSNKIDTKPSIPEEVQLWVEELLEEGYDLSEYTWEDMYEFYINEANSAVAPAGDAETQTVDSSAKRRTAQMQIRKELADVQLAKSKAQSGQTNESVISYLENRYNIFG